MANSSHSTQSDATPSGAWSEDQYRQQLGELIELDSMATIQSIDVPGGFGRLYAVELQSAVGIRQPRLARVLNRREVDQLASDVELLKSTHYITSTKALSPVRAAVENEAGAVLLFDPDDCDLRRLGESDDSELQRFAAALPRILNGLDAIHSQGEWHGAISPTTIRFAGSHSVAEAALVFDPAETHRSRNSPEGAFDDHYRPIGQRLKSQTPTASDDLYALGVVIAELLVPDVKELYRANQKEFVQSIRSKLRQSPSKRLARMADWLLESPSEPNRSASSAVHRWSSDSTHLGKSLWRAWAVRVLLLALPVTLLVAWQSHQQSQRQLAEKDEGQVRLEKEVERHEKVVTQLEAKIAQLRSRPAPPAPFRPAPTTAAAPRENVMEEAIRRWAEWVTSDVSFGTLKAQLTRLSGDDPVRRQLADWLGAFEAQNEYTLLVYDGSCDEGYGLDRKITVGKESVQWDWQQESTSGDVQARIHIQWNEGEPIHVRVEQHGYLWNPNLLAATVDGPLAIWKLVGVHENVGDDGDEDGTQFRMKIAVLDLPGPPPDVEPPPLAAEVMLPDDDDAIDLKDEFKL